MKFNSKFNRWFIPFVLTLSLVFTMSGGVFADTLDDPFDTQVTEIEQFYDGIDNDAELDDVVKPDEDSDETAPEELPLLTDSVGLSAATGITIKHVEVLYGGEVQENYRNAEGSSNVSRYTVYNGNDPLAANGEVAGKYYTTSREGSLSDPRIFTVEFSVPSAGYPGGLGDGANQFTTGAIQWRYDGKRLEEVGADEDGEIGDGTSRDGEDFMRIEQGSLNAEINGANIVVTAGLRIGAISEDIQAYYESDIFGSMNIPWEEYYIWNGGSTSWMLSAIGDVRNGETRDKVLAAYYGAPASGSLLADRGLRINIYDSYHTWTEIDAWARNPNREYLSGNSALPGRFLKMDTIGKSTEDREMWTVVISDSNASINEYLTVTRPRITNDPGKVNLNAKVPLYFSSIHAREVIGPDITMEIIDRLMTEKFLISSRLKDETTKYNRINPRGDGTNGSGANPNAGARRINKPNDASGAVGTGKFDSDFYEEVKVDVDELLSKYIIVMTFSSNPDSRDLAQRTNSYQFDLNRDASYLSQVETRRIGGAFGTWDPLTMLEFHGYYLNFTTDACTPPHEPNFEYDLFRKNDLNVRIVDSLGMGFIGSNTPYNLYTVPTRDVTYGWDDGTTIYTPTLSMLYGAYSSTIEFPSSSQDSIDAGVAGVYSFFDFCIKNKEEMLKNKLEYKRRGVQNVDEKSIDKWFVTVDPFIDALGLIGPSETVGRPRDEKGKFFPEYYIIPVDPENQRNIPAAIEMLQTFKIINVDVEKTNKTVAYNGVTYPVGTYVVNMRQGNRNVANAMLYEGYDASIYPRLYNNMVVNHPDMRGFDCVTVRTVGLFKGKSAVVDSILKPAAQIPNWGTYVIIKNNSADAARLVNRILNDGKDAWMIKATNNLAKIGDFVVKRADINAKLTGTNKILGELSLCIDGLAAGDNLPVNAVPLIKPYVGMYASDYERNIEYLLDLYEFEDRWDYYNEWDSNTKVNVMLSYYGRNHATQVINNWIADEIRGDGDSPKPIPFIYAGTRYRSGVPYGIANQILGGVGSEGWPNSPIDYGYLNSRGEALVKGSYANDSLLTAGFGTQKTMYINSGVYMKGLPDYFRPLATVAESKDFFRAGWWYSESGVEQAKLKGQTMVASGIYDNGGNPFPVAVMADNVFDKCQAQINYRLVSNAIFAFSSGIADGQVSEGSDNLYKCDAGPTIDKKGSWTAGKVNIVNNQFSANNTEQKAMSLFYAVGPENPSKPLKFKELKAAKEETKIKPVSVAANPGDKLWIAKDKTGTNKAVFSINFKPKAPAAKAAAKLKISDPNFVVEFTDKKNPGLLDCLEYGVYTKNMKMGEVKWYKVPKVGDAYKLDLDDLKKSKAEPAKGDIVLYRYSGIDFPYYGHTPDIDATKDKGVKKGPSLKN